MSKRILIVGSGGREHAIAKALDQSPQVDRIYLAPGNPGVLANTQKTQLVAIDQEDFASLLDLVDQEGIDWTIVGPEKVLEAGIVDVFRQAGQTIIGPSQAATQIESSKYFAKQVMAQAGVATSNYRLFNQDKRDEVENYITSLPLPIVLKKDGLASGKGVYICQTYEEALSKAQDLLGSLDQDLIVEEFLDGEEFSHFALVNESHVIPLGLARDHKRAYDGGKGPNTGGMGAYSPVTDQDQAFSQEIVDKIVQPVADQMKDLGQPFTGVLFTGLMRVNDRFYVIEFNARFGDPETQVLLPRLETDLVDLFQAHLNQTEVQVNYQPGCSLGVILASAGYPGQVDDGKDLNWAGEVDQANLVYSGVAENQGQLVTKGGRILMVQAMTDSLQTSRQQVYDVLAKQDVEGSFYRKDIGL